VDRVKLNQPASGGKYFPPVSTVQRIGTGCHNLDLSIGGGWAEGRVINLVGDTSTGKSLLAIEACTTFAQKYTSKQAVIRYDETEAAFDMAYAEGVGLPVDRVEFNENERTDTVELLHKNIDKFATLVEKRKYRAGMYIVDSLDPIGDEAEKEAELGAASYGTKKPALIGKLFRKEVRRLEGLNITLFIVSQVRDKINAMFGKKLTRSGGHALDFYSSQIVWLADVGKVKETRGGIERKIGAWTRAKCEKNKTGVAWRECEFFIRYGYGIDEFETGLTFLLESDRLSKLIPEAKGLNKKESTALVSKWLHKLDTMDRRQIDTTRSCLNNVLTSVWNEIESRFAPVRKKYE